MNFQLRGKKALITGGYSALSTAITECLEKEHVEVWQQIFPDESTGFKTGAERLIQADARTPEQMKRLKEEVLSKAGTIHIVINIPAAFAARSLKTIEVKEWDEWMEYQLDVPFLSCKEMIPHLVQNGGGTVVNVSSSAAVTGELSPAYAAASSALNSMTRGLSLEFKEKKVTVSGIAPALFLESSQKSADVNKAAAAMAVLLCSPHGAFFAGETISIDGGESIG